MAGFCGNCGAPIEDGAKVCGNCGTPVVSVKSGNIDLGNQVQNSYKQVREMVKKPVNYTKYIAIGVAALVVVVLCIVAGTLISANTGYKGTFKKYFAAVNDGDEKKAASLISDSYCYVYGSNDLEDYLEAKFDNLKDEYGKYKITYKYKDVEKLKKSDLEDYKDLADRLLDGVKTDFDVDSIKAVYKVDIRYNLKGKDGSTHDNVTVFAIKENGKWKLSDSIL
ncbi:MAG: zinc-ribbon domain-containing protein [Lachnospiraceae bacterium]|nr:zinc-ribbon domain-containing protein [Lachnospiraceae bacterium]